ncbi:MAG: V-type ATPase 116kDa subunit family protein [Sphaerochaetaceae bacterium]|jgi:V/A-type H+-transporting ATPase subunit I|nr:V-type ATPase 116kDa subunit family protein [Sphaerochaetaceae bacterium]MDD3162957.1 V-type ATPase 116kDa subunit family protein [Sphaerochaetaceae bacterium]MDD4006938.1 V-type ATPase 116kDa subunit family protein [Sphaerochaetaceae bacterium]MDD4396415.1 V-type ATPase 116kDa subunit family protein [Sphaerochaetaceae bacterium]
MIEKMYKAYLVSKLSDKHQMLSALRDLGLMHIKTEKAGSDSEELGKLRSELASLQKVKMNLDERVDKKHPAAQAELSDKEFALAFQNASAAIEKLKETSEELGRKRMKLSELSIWGDYSLDDYRMISSNGIKLYFYTLPKKEVAKLGPECSFIVLSPVGGQFAIASVGAPLAPEYGAAEFKISDTCPAMLSKEISELDSEFSELKGQLDKAVSLRKAFELRIKDASEKVKFEMARCATSDEQSLCWIIGFIPESGLDAFRKYASDNKYAFMLDDVKEEDNPPTKVVYNKITRLMQPLFDMLGTIPGYYEYDISLWFLLFFALFFAMIIGDAAYGLIFVGLAVYLHVKQKKTSNLVLLVYVLGIATVCWGALTGTWFGSQSIIEKSKFLQLFVIKDFASFPAVFGVAEKTAQDTVMQFCFIVGTIQLSLACIMNVIRKTKEKNLSAVADLGWLVMIDALYFLALVLVLNRTVDLVAVATAVGIGFLLVIAFGSQGPGIKFGKGLAGGAGGLFTTFLNTISAFGNIMSYIRLFAVGMASVEIAKSFNSMASGMLSGFAIPAGVLILVIGHSLNIVMGLLSVVVHGVRLNLLEFSGQLGMTWTGIAYEPFCKSAESK